MFQNVCSKKILVEQAKSLVLFYVRFAQVCPCVVVTVVGVVGWGMVQKCALCVSHFTFFDQNYHRPKLELQSIKTFAVNINKVLQPI